MSGITPGVAVVADTATGAQRQAQLAQQQQQAQQSADIYNVRQVPASSSFWQTEAGRQTIARIQTQQPVGPTGPIGQGNLSGRTTYTPGSYQEYRQIAQNAGIINAQNQWQLGQQGTISGQVQRADIQGTLNKMTPEQQLALGTQAADATGLPHLSSLTYGEVMKGTWPVSGEVQQFAFGKGVGAKEGGPYQFRILTAEGALYATPSGAWELMQMGQIKASGSAGSLGAILEQPGRYARDVSAMGLVPMSQGTQARLAAEGATPSTITSQGAVFTFPVYSPQYQAFSLQAATARQTVENLMSEARAKQWVEGSTVMLPPTAEGLTFGQRFNAAVQNQADIYNRALVGGVIVPKPGGIAGGGGYLPGPGQVRTGVDIISGREIVQSGQLAKGETFSSPVLAAPFIAGIRPTGVSPAANPITGQQPPGISVGGGWRLTSIGIPTGKTDTQGRQLVIQRLGNVKDVTPITPGTIGSGAVSMEGGYSQIHAMTPAERTAWMAANPLAGLRYSELFMEKEWFTPMRGGVTAEEFWARSRAGIAESALPASGKTLITWGSYGGEYIETHATGTAASVLGAEAFGIAANVGSEAIAAAPAGSWVARTAPYIMGAYKGAQYLTVGAVAAGSAVTIGTSPTPFKTSAQVTAQLLPWVSPWYVENLPSFSRQVVSRLGLQTRQATPEEVAQMGRVKQRGQRQELVTAQEIDLSNVRPEDVKLTMGTGELTELPGKVVSVSPTGEIVTETGYNTGPTMLDVLSAKPNMLSSMEMQSLLQGRALLQAAQTPLAQISVEVVQPMSPTRMSYPFVLAGGQTAIGQTAWLDTGINTATVARMNTMIANDPILGSMQGVSQAVPQAVNVGTIPQAAGKETYSLISLPLTSQAISKARSQYDLVVAAQASAATEKAGMATLGFTALDTAAVPLLMPAVMPALVPMEVPVAITTQVPPPVTPTPEIPWFPVLPSFGGGGGGGMGPRRRPFSFVNISSAGLDISFAGPWHVPEFRGRGFEGFKHQKKKKGKR
jgi:hypothetical protein